MLLTPSFIDVTNIYTMYLTPFCKQRFKRLRFIQFLNQYFYLRNRETFAQNETNMLYLSVVHYFTKLVKYIIASPKHLRKVH